MLPKSEKYSAASRALKLMLAALVGLTATLSCQRKSEVLQSSDRALNQGINPIRRLSNLEYLNSLTDALGYQFIANMPPPKIDPTGTILAKPQVVGALAELSGDLAGIRLGSTETDPSVDASRFTAYLDISAAIAQVIAGNTTYLKAITPGGCGTSNVPDPSGESCESKFVKQFGRFLFRGPVEDSDLQDILSGSTSWITVIGRLLTHPRFLLKIERSGKSLATLGNVYELNAYELEARLASVYWKSIPDPIGIQAAASGSILTEAGLKAEIERMLNSPKAKDALWTFYSQWLATDRIPQLGNEPTNQYIAFAAPLSIAQVKTLRPFILDDTRQFLEHFTWETEGTLRDVFTSPLIFTTNPVLASIYGVAPRASVTAPPASNPKYPGLLSRPVVTVQKTVSGGEINQVQRGILIVTNILGVDLRNPAAAAAQQAASDTIPPDASSRLRYTMMTAAPACQVCHVLINPNGFVLSHYDGLGRYIDVEKRYDLQGTLSASNQVISSGTSDFGTGRYYAFTDLPSYLAALTSSGRLEYAFAKYYFRYAMGRLEDRNGKDECLLQQLRTSLRGPGGSIRNMLRTMPLSPCFKTSTVR